MENLRKKKEEIGKRLKEARLALALTQEEFGEVIGIARATVSNLECGKMDPAMPKYLKCFDAFHNINQKWLLTGEGEMFLLPKELRLFSGIIEKATPGTLTALKNEVEKVKAVRDENFFNTKDNQFLELTDRSKAKSEKSAKEIIEKCRNMKFEKQCQIFLTAALLIIGEGIGAERIKSENIESCDYKNNWKECFLTIGKYAGETEQKLIEKEAGLRKIKK